MNNVSIVGNLVRDPELKKLPTGTPIIEFSIAYNARRKSGDKWEEIPNFFECEFFGSRAESLNEYMHKGDRVGITGTLEQQSWKKDGQTRSKVVIHVNDIDLLSPRSSNSSDSTRQAKSNFDNSRSFSGPENFSDNEVPF